MVRGAGYGEEGATAQRHSGRAERLKMIRQLADILAKEPVCREGVYLSGSCLLSSS